MNEFYLQVLKSRLEYFEGKAINELTNAEIKEYLALRAEVQEMLSSVKEVMAAILKPYSEAVHLYVKRTKEKTKGMDSEGADYEWNF